MKEGETQIITYTIQPVDADAELTWQSSNIAVATVNDYGLVTAVSQGTCVITVVADGKSASVVVTVKAKGPDFQALYLDLTSTYGWTLGSDNSYLSADTNVLDLDDYTSTSILYEIENMNEKLGLPASLYNDMLQTTWSMGKQQETYTNLGLTVTWTYHPDKGLEVTYKLLAN